MLQKLYIKNFAIIDEIEINFDKGFTILTGETGAGKSILLGALSLLLGERADSSLLQDSNSKCIIEGYFSIKDNFFAGKFLKENDFDTEQEVIIRREIAPASKSRIFINDTPATLSILHELAEFLIDMHRQFDTIELKANANQLIILDDIIGHDKLLLSFSENYVDWKKSKIAYEKIKSQNEVVRKELDYNQYLFDELQILNLQENELEHIEAELQVLNNSESLKQSFEKSIILLEQNEFPVLGQLKNIIQNLEANGSKHGALDELIRRIKSSFIELKDIHSDLEDLYENTNYDEEKITILTERLNEGNRLLKKHNVTTTEALLVIKHELDEKVNAAISADEDEAKLLQELNTKYSALLEIANKLSTSRKKHIASIEKEVDSLLKKVGMPNAMFKISIEEIEVGQSGIDRIEFLLDTNKTGKFKPIYKTASGGELSRLMLCIKSLLAKSTHLPTLIFDEIDTGISGETAIQVGNLMKQLSQNHQVISITHLPQIAGKANQHLYIYKKESKSGSINTRIKSLNNDERIDILAEMLHGKDSNAKTKEMAKELINRNE